MNIKSVLCVLGMGLALSSAAFAANKEEKDHSNKDENGKFVYGPYHTNQFKDNWFIGLSAGFNTFMQKDAGYKAGWTECIEADFGKWFTPTLGLRIGYQGFRGIENYTGAEGSKSENKESFGFAYIHGDVLWNISHTIGGYRTDRLWNFVPYAHFGYLRLYSVDAPDSKHVEHRKRTNNPDNEFAFGAGLLNLIRVHERVNLTLDGRVSTFNGRFHDWAEGNQLCHVSATFGLQVLLGKTTWERCEGGEDNSAAIAEALAALAAAKELNDALGNDQKNLLADKDSLSSDGKNLRDEIERLRNLAPTIIENIDTVYIDRTLGIAPCKLYFAKNISDLSVTEKMHLRFYIQNVIEKDPDRVFYFTGSADSSTGNDKINSRLSKERVDKTIDYIVKEYGISRDRLQYRDAKILDENKDELSLDRAVLIEHY